MKRLFVYALYGAYRLTWPLDRFTYLWRIPLTLGVWYLRAYMRRWPLEMADKEERA
jgi:hypothetical protein